MQQKRQSTRETLAKNLKRLMDRHAMSQPDLAKKSGVSQTQISNILRQATGCSVDNADALASVFLLNGWQLLMRDLPDELLDSPHISKLIQSYLITGEEGRGMIDRVAEREAIYVATNKRK